MDDQGLTMQALADFSGRAAIAEGNHLDDVDGRLVLRRVDQPDLVFSTDRRTAIADGGIQLLGIDHPVVQKWLEQFASLPPDERGIIGAVDGMPSGVATIWCVVIQSDKQQRTLVSTIGLTPDGRRQFALEAIDRILGEIRPSSGAGLDLAVRKRLLDEVVGEVLHRDLEHAGLLNGATYTATLLGWVEVAG